MKPQAKIILALTLLAASGFITQIAFFKQSVQGVTALTQSIPPTLGRWHLVASSPISESEIRGLETRDIVRRTYSDGQMNIELVVAYISQSSRKSAHAQEACLRGAGAMVGEIKTWQMPNTPVSSKLIALDFHNQRQWVCYWYKIGDLHTAAYLRSSWLMFFGGLSGRKTGGASLIRLLALQSPGQSPDAIRQGFDDFTASLLPDLKQRLP